MKQNKLKIGILTFHRAINIGAVLQASALQNFILQMGVECEIIDYVPNNLIPPKPNIVRDVLKKIKKTIAFILRYNKSIKQIKFRNYRNKYLILSENTYLGDGDLKKANLNYSLLISGSDQILNTTLTGNSRAY